ncbi:axoneme-associated protein mst101(2)-like [Schistocerca nitens]|uniref:axoneme-associated protein mst101(2)-like n=1 Tax=Schistocerca nitens TaxID=7011 RepID=UPI00211823FC|nr:axoneme-associated protein mst101(2)-like [Schistocerca nitens]
MEYNLKKAIREVPKRLKMNVDERESKLQTNIEQVQGDVEKTEEELTKKTEEDVEENRTEMEEKITEVMQMQKQCNNVVEKIEEDVEENGTELGEKNIEVTQMQKQCNNVVEKIEEDVEETRIEMGEKITEVTQMQKQCDDVVEKIEEDVEENGTELGKRTTEVTQMQKQLAVNLRNAVAMQREDDQRDAIEGEAFTCGIKRKRETTDNDQFGRELLKECWPKGRQCTTLENPLRCRPLSNGKGTSEEIAKHSCKLNETLERPLSDNVMVSAIKRRLNQKRQGTVSRSPIKGREALMKILEQLESIRSQKYKQANDRNREGSNDPRIHINHSSDFRGRGGGTNKPNDTPDEVRSRVRAIMTQNKHARTWLGQLAVKWTIERKGFVYICALCYITVRVAYFMSKTISE